MKTSHDSRIARLRRLAGASGKAGVLAAGFLLAATATVSAQNARPDPRWQAWLGCWTPEEGAAPADARTHLVCVVPVPGTAGVEIAALADAQIVSLDTLVASGEHRAISRDGCDGWESAEWSGEGQRVYLHSEVTCPGNLRRTTSGLMAITPDGQWLDARGVAVRGQMAVHVVRYADAGLPTTVPAEIVERLSGRGLAVGLARQAASAPVTLADVVEASHHIEPALVEAWLAGSGQGFALDAKKLVALSDSGVSDRVIDVMVALSYPKMFAVNATSGLDEFAPVSETRRAPIYADSLYGTRLARPWCYSPWGWDYYGSWGYAPYGCGAYSPFGYSPFWYGPYGYGYNPWYGGYGYGGGTVLIVGGGGGTPAQGHGRLVKGRGYVPGGQAAGTGSRARPRERSAPSAQAAGSGGGGSRRATGSSRSPSAGSSPRSSGSTSSRPSSGSSTGRTAHRRP
jgi:hypothetical protein